MTLTCEYGFNVLTHTSTDNSFLFKLIFQYISLFAHIFKDGFDTYRLRIILINPLWILVCVNITFNFKR